MSAWTDWLLDPDAARALLAEVRAWSGGAEVVRYLATHPMITAPTDTPANVAFEQRLTGSPTFTRRMPEAFGGRTTVGWGGLEIDNADGALDGWLEDAWDGRRVVLRLGDPGWGYSQYQTILDGIIERLEVVDDATLRLAIRDRQAVLNVPAQTALLTSGPRAGEPRPLALGLVRNVTPVLLDPATLLYQVHDGPIEALSAVYDQGVALTPGSGYTANLAAGTFQLLAAPAGAITCDVQGAKPAGVWLSTVGALARWLVTREGVLTDPTDLDTASLTALDTAAPYTLGLYIPERRNLLDVLDELLGSVGGFYGFTRAGLFQVGRLEAPAGPPALTLDEIETCEELRVGLAELPRWRTRLGYERNWTVQEAGALAGVVTVERRGWLAEAYRTTTASDAAVQTAHRLARDPETEPTLIDAPADATAEATRRQALFGVQRFTYHPRAAAAPYQLELGTVVRLQDARFGLALGVDCRVIGLTEHLLDNTVDVGLWR